MFILFQKNCDSISVTYMLFEKLISNHELSREFIINRDKLFTNKFLKNFHSRTRNKTKDVNSISFSDRWSEWKNRSNSKNIFVSLCQQKSEQLNMTTVYSTFVYNNTKWNHEKDHFMWIMNTIQRYDGFIWHRSQSREVILKIAEMKRHITISERK